MATLPQHLDANRSSAIRVFDQWYIACRSSALRRKPLARTILDVPLVLFRDATGAASALLDRCSHRNMPLSLGKVVDSHLECPYHGWRFDGEGSCRLVPAFPGSVGGKGREVPRYPLREQQGYIWVWMAADPIVANVTREPYSFPHADDPSYVTLSYQACLDAPWHVAAENILDLPHTVFVHGGVLRGAKRNRVGVIVRRSTDRVEAEFIGEPTPNSLMAKIIAPGGGIMQHWDRFVMPSVAEVEYALGEANHIIGSNVLTPESQYRTWQYATVSMRMRFATRLMSYFFKPVSKWVVRQDATILRKQTAALRRFGDEDFASSPADLLGPHIWHMLRQAERGERDVEETREKRLEIVL